MRVNGVQSSLRRAEAGVPQGSVLSPTLFGLYVNDAPLLAERRTGIQRCGLLMFADDFAYYAKSANSRQAVRYLNECLAAFPSWLRQKRLTLNLEKCVAVNFTRQRADPEETVLLAGAHLPWSPCARYLGVTLDRGLYWHEHAKDLRHKILARTSLLRPLLGSPDLSLSQKRLLFTACIRSLWTYACETSAAAPVSTLRPIWAAENRAVRTATRPHLPPPPPNRHHRNSVSYGALGVSRQLPEEIRRRAHTALTRALGPKAPRLWRETGRAVNCEVHRTYFAPRGPKQVAATFRALPPQLLAELCEQRREAPSGTSEAPPVTTARAHCA